MAEFNAGGRNYVTTGFFYAVLCTGLIKERTWDGADG